MHSRNEQIQGELHIVLMGLMLELSYPIKEDALGLCNDFAEVIRKAFFNDQIAKYNEIINYVDNVLKYDDLKKNKKKTKKPKPSN